VIFKKPERRLIAPGVVEITPADNEASLNQYSEQARGRPVSCGDDLTLADARETYKSVAGRGALESMLEGHACEAEALGLHRWAPKERVKDGTIAFARFVEHVRDGRLFEQPLPHGVRSTGSLGHVAVDSELSTATEQHLALCEVLRVGRAVGPPLNCVTVAIVTPAETWLRTVDPRWDGICPTSASFRSDGAIDIQFDVLTKSSPAPLSTSLVHVLQSELKLTAEQEVSMRNGVANYIEIRSAAPLRNSQILPGGWREAIDFTISLFSVDAGVRISGTAHALVSRQAVGSLTQYQGMDDAQRTVYAQALDLKVNSAIRAACKNYRQRDARTILCD
jgi:hypothetical protein